MSSRYRAIADPIFNKQGRIKNEKCLYRGSERFENTRISGGLCSLQTTSKRATRNNSDGREHGRLDFYFYHLIRRNRNENFLNIPAHDTCIKGVPNNFLKRFILILILAVSIGLIGILYHFGPFYSAIVALLVVTPFLYWQFTEPVPVEYMHYSGKFVLIFKDRNYATDVAHLNHVHLKEGRYPYGQPVME